MFNVNGETGDIICRQGDSGELVLEGIPEDHDYEAYFSFYNNKRVIIKEISATVLDGQVTFHIAPSMTDALVVPNGTPFATYFYGVKLCYRDEEGLDHEDTVLIGEKSIGEVNKVIVYPKIVEGY